ncbi:nuclease-related domain-containing protein [Marinobacter salsuginis]|uniref:nuclease-related domain-containing protein n=1 Tax=Marinobacter salsuginis TaxID=418719 RepID=UPI001ADF7C9D|nr:NERD domain-containing protein [Marinobacter salsuginis]QTN43324.1 NERD domain-containing protein [Marinobacter salsuginis]
MDYNQILHTLQNNIPAQIWYLIPFFLVAVVIKSAWFKGKAGEAVVNLSAKLFLDKTRYHLIKNVTVPTEDGTTQIDHIIVSRYGVFVVETKNMKGWIFGNAKQRYWTQKIFKYSQKFQNPLHQNYKHVKTLQNLLDLSDEQVFSVVVFVGDSTIKTPMPENVTHGGGYVRYIKAQTEQRLSDAEVQKVIDAIESGRLAATFRNHRSHVNHVKEVVARKNSEPRCPKCQGEMVKRRVKCGENIGKEFLGCKEFPKCRGIVGASLLQ